MALPQDQPIVDRPRMHHVDSGFARVRIVGTAQRLAMHDLALVGQLRVSDCTQAETVAKAKYGQTRGKERGVRRLRNDS